MPHSPVLVYDREHWRTIKGLLAEAKEVIVVSPWLTEEPAKALVEWVERTSGSLRVVFRWPDSARDAGTDRAALELLLKLQRDHDHVRIGYVRKRLHAKLYLFDDARGVVTSANFTGAGMGMRKTERSNNLEVGVQIGSLEAKELAGWVRRLNPQPYNAKVHARLVRWLATVEHAMRALPTPPSPPKARRAPQRALKAVVTEVLDACVDAAVITHVAAPPPGLGKKFFRLTLPGWKVRPVVKANASDPDSSGYHFDLTDKDQDRFESGDLQAILCVPYVMDGDTPVPATDAPQAFLIPLERLFDERIGLPKRTLRRQERLRCHVVEREGNWEFEIPDRKGSRPWERAVGVLGAAPGGKLLELLELVDPKEDR